MMQGDRPHISGGEATKGDMIEQITSAARKRTVTSPESILLAAQGSVDIQPMVRLLDQANRRTSPRDETDFTPFPPRTTLHVLDGLQDAHRQLQDQPGAHLLLLYRDPVAQIAESIAAEVDPEAAVAQWQEQADEILSTYRRARRRITLLEMSAAQAEPNAAIQALNEHLGLSLSSLADADQTQAQTQPERDPIHVLIAERALHQDTRARHAAAELEASALPLTGTNGAPHIDLSSTVHSYREKSEVPLEQVNGLKEENELLHSQLEQVQEQLKSQTSRGKELKKKLQDAENLNDRLTEENQHLKSQDEAARARQSEHEDLREENELLLAQLHQVQEELESYFLENQDITRQLNESQKKNQELEGQIHEARGSLQAVYASWSWKITTPLRLLLRPFMGK